MDDLQRLRGEVDRLHAQVIDAEAAHTAALAAVHPRHKESARNLVHYMALRQRDLRALQLELWQRGFSSLGRLEGHTLDAVERAREQLDDALARHGAAVPWPASGGGVSWDEGERLLHEHTRDLLGPPPADRHVYIMVTAPDAAEADDAWAERTLAAGMNLLRVNAAHEDEEAWGRTVATVRRAAERRGTSCRVVVDLPGPKLRTVALAEGTRVARWRPERDELGRVTKPCAVALWRSSRSERGEGTWLAVPDAVFDALERGDQLVLRDARGKKRRITVVEHAGDVASGALSTTAYVIPGATVTRWRGGSRMESWQVDDVPARPFRLRLHADDRFRLVRPQTPPPADPALPMMGCTLEAALAALRPGHRVIFDDGSVHAVVEGVDATGALLRVTHVPGSEAHLGSEKGINLPDTEMDLPLLGPDDERALAFAVQHADVVDASFIRGPDDVRALHRRLDELSAAHLGVVLKIETRSGFERLPAVLLAAMERYPAGVMIARGDLAIETSFERLAELQEEILWLCEAAHLPVVWATQVLADLARSGQPSRAEVTDAAMAVRAECAMLNKGPFIAEAVRALADILRRMEQHQYKKRNLYRRLHLELPGAPSIAHERGP